VKVLVLLRGWRREPGGALDVEKLGPHERAALGAAFALREAREDTQVIALAAGGDQDDEALAVADALGADETYRIWDPILGDVDDLGVAQALAYAAKHIGFDVILAGFRSPDLARGFMGPAVAECLEIQHLSAVDTLRWERDTIAVERSCICRKFTHKLPVPCLITVASGPVAGATKPTEGYQPNLLTLEDVSLQEPMLRPRIRLKGVISAHEKEGYVTAWVDDAATVVEHLREVDILLQ
jgi:electron transfer flavoprotein alpha subunit